MKGIIDWNGLTIEQYIEHLEEKFMYDSSGTAKAVFELISAYKVLAESPIVDCKHKSDYTPCYNSQGELMFKQCDICGGEFD